jgi:hypothetical protein
MRKRIPASLIKSCSYNIKITEPLAKEALKSKKPIAPKMPNMMETEPIMPQSRTNVTCSINLDIEPYLSPLRFETYIIPMAKDN